MARLASLLLVVFAVHAVPAGAEQRIVGGQPASRAYPHQAFVEVGYASRMGWCGGSLIAARYVVTAGHCLQPHDGEAVERVDVAIGVTQVDHRPGHGMATGTSSIPADKQYLDVGWEVHPQWVEVMQGASDNDVAILTLPRPAPEAQLRLPRPADAALWAAGVESTAIGWGLTENGVVADDLREVVVPVVEDSFCTDGYNPVFRPATMICAGGVSSGKDTCQGDSGGPLLAPDGGDGFVLAGVTSWGAACGSYPGVYGRVGIDPLNAWIRSKVPQVEIDGAPASAEPGQSVAFNAASVNLGGSGPFGGYDHLAWDLDGDGTYAEALDDTSVTRTMVAGLNKVSVKATTDDDSEIRTIPVMGRYRSLVSFAVGEITLTEGQPAALVVNKTSLGTGTVTATVSTGTVAPTTLNFASDQASQLITVPTVDDTIVEGPQTFRVDLAGHTGELVPASPGSVTVTVLDNDVRVDPTAFTDLKRRVRAKRGRLKAVVTISQPGALRATLRSRGGRTLGVALSRVVNTSGRHSLSVRLNSRGRRAIRGRRQVKGKLTIVFSPGDASPSVIIRRAVIVT